MTLLLASITEPDEAEIARRGGADIVDVVDPSLGAPSAAAVSRTIALLGGARPVSALIGPAARKDDRVLADAQALAATGLAYLRVSLAGDDIAERLSALAPLAQKTRLVAVLPAPGGLPEQTAEALARSGFAGAVISAREAVLAKPDDLLGLNSFVDTCRRHELLAGIEGAIEEPDIPRLLLLGPDILAPGTALRIGENLDVEAVRRMSDLIAAAAREPAPKLRSPLGDGQPSVGGPAPAASPPADIVFVRGFVLPARIGAYARERGGPQNLRFSVDLEVERQTGVPHEMRDVLSYDVITDGVRLLVANHYFAFVEALAERIAALALSYPRVLRARVRVEKLDLGPGTVGVEIVRERG